MDCGEMPPAVATDATPSSASAVKIDAFQICEEFMQPKILEVHCKSCGNVSRFARGTDAGFAVYLINSKLGCGFPPALYIEATKEGEEPISFGPKATLVNYGKGWKLQTVIKGGYDPTSRNQQITKVPSETSFVWNAEGLGSAGSVSISSFQYFAKILIVLAAMFLLGGALVFLLENLPMLIKLVASS